MAGISGVSIVKNTTQNYRCQVQQRVVVVVRFFQEASGIGDDEMEYVQIQARCSREQACTDLHRCPLPDE